MPEKQALSGRHAVITGAAKGIGAAIADRLDAEGASITLMGRTPETLELKAQNLNKAQAVQVDVASEDSVIEAFSKASNTLGPVDILVNNAGAALSAPLHRTQTSDWQYMLDVNLSGAFYCCREVTPAMRKNNWGRIINIASIAGLSGAAYISAYCAAKHGVIGLTRALAMELANKDITVNALCPGYTNTELLDGALNNIMEKTGLSRSEAEAQLKSSNPQNRFIEPEEIAASVAWLCLPGSEGITGQALPITGGGSQA